MDTAEFGLPVYRTSFVGRDAELRELTGLLADPTTRFVTVVGRSGIGKTRLAVEAGRDAAAVRGRAVLVELANARDDGDVARLLAEALETDRVPGQSAEDAVRRQLRSRPALVVADDVDRVPGAAAALLDLLSASSTSVVLATAQRPPSIAAGRVVRLDGLGVPDVARDDRRTLLSHPAVALYADRASAVDPGFRLTRENIEEVARLAQRLDGLPLSIELCAARAHILSPRAQLAALDEHSPLELRSRAGLVGGAPHRDVRSAVAISYGAAAERARLVLKRMSVVADAATSGRVRHLVTEPGWTLADVLDGLAELVDLGLVDVDPRADGEPRFRLHPTVAAFARERLEIEDDAEAVRRRYAAGVLATAAAARTMPHRRRLEALTTSSAELHAVFSWLADRSDVEDALELAADLGPLWEQRGLFHGPGSRFEAMLGAGEGGTPVVAPETLARAQLWWTRLVIHDESPSAHRDAVVARLARGVENARASGDGQLVLFALESVVWAVFVTGDMGATSEAVAEGLGLATEAGDRTASRRFGYFAAMLAHLAGDTEAALRFARPVLEDAVRDRDLIDTIRVCSVLWRIPAGTPGLPPAIPGADSLLNACIEAKEVVYASLLYAVVAGHALRDGDVQGAARSALAGLELAEELGAWYAAGMTMTALSLVASREGSHRTVAALYGSLTPVLPAVIIGLGPEAPMFQAAVEASRSAMGAAAFDRIVADGAMLDRDTAIERAAAYAHSLVPTAGRADDHTPLPNERREPQARSALLIPRRATPGHTDHLTPRELDILRALMTGATNGVIAAALGLRPKTVMHHSVSIYAKLGVRGRTEATAWAYRNGVSAEPIPEAMGGATAPAQG